MTIAELESVAARIQKASMTTSTATAATAAERKRAKLEGGGYFFRLTVNCCTSITSLLSDYNACAGHGQFAAAVHAEGSRAGHGHGQEEE